SMPGGPAMTRHPLSVVGISVLTGELPASNQAWQRVEQKRPFSSPRRPRQTKARPQTKQGTMLWEVVGRLRSARIAAARFAAFIHFLSKWAPVALGLSSPRLDWSGRRTRLFGAGANIDLWNPPWPPFR